MTSLQAGKEPACFLLQGRQKELRTRATWGLLLMCKKKIILHNDSEWCRDGSFSLGVHYMNSWDSLHLVMHQCL